MSEASENMINTAGPGYILILNGAPRSGKSSIASFIRQNWEGIWISLGVDVSNAMMIPERLKPGIGLRPGAERTDLEMIIPRLYEALFLSAAAHSRLGFHVVMDLGLHDDYSAPLDLAGICGRSLQGLPVLRVGLDCPLEEILRRRDKALPGRENLYKRSTPGDPVPEPVLRWQQEIHRQISYDLRLDTLELSVAACAAIIKNTLQNRHPVRPPI